MAHKTITVKFDNFILPSFNHFYSQGIHYRRRSEMVYKWKIAMRAMLIQQVCEAKIIELSKSHHIEIRIVVRQAKRVYDVDNCVMYGKLFLDTLKLVGLKDDSPKYVYKISYEIDLTVKENSAIYTIIY